MARALLCDVVQVLLHICVVLVLRANIKANQKLVDLQLIKTDPATCRFLVLALILFLGVSSFGSFCQSEHQFLTDLTFHSHTSSMEDADQLLINR